MKFIDYTHKMGSSYRTVWRWYKTGTINCLRRAKRKTETIAKEVEAEHHATG